MVGCRLICNRFSADLLFLLKMKHVPTITTADVLHKIENIEKEVMDLKLSGNKKERGQITFVKLKDLTLYFPFNLISLHENELDARRGVA